MVKNTSFRGCRVELRFVFTNEKSLSTQSWGGTSINPNSSPFNVSSICGRSNNEQKACHMKKAAISILNLFEENRTCLIGWFGYVSSRSVSRRRRILHLVLKVVRRALQKIDRSESKNKWVLMVGGIWTGWATFWWCMILPRRDDDIDTNLEYSLIATTRNREVLLNASVSAWLVVLEQKLQTACYLD